MKTTLFAGATFILLLYSCGPKNHDMKDEQIRVDTADTQVTGDSMVNSIAGNATLNQIPTKPNAVILTGLANHRLVSIYKAKPQTSTSRSRDYYSSETWYGSETEMYEHFMPGIDILFGWNLMNIAHYDMKAEKTNLLFNHPVLVKTLYYPAFVQDSVDKKPINRNYYLVSVYDEDTNKDTLVNRKDLRRIYSFDSTGTTRTQLVPSDYSVIRSQYDPQNDVMYIFARQDADKNGTEDSKEPIHIFWISLKAPAAAKRLY